MASVANSPQFDQELQPWSAPLARRGVAEAGASTAFPEATNAALEMLRAGGNAIDAAVAAAWALSVCEPSASGLGGQSTLLVYHANGTMRVIDGHSYAPAAASTDTIDARQQRFGHRACTIPTTPATLAYAQRKYGMLRPSQVLEPAIRIAEEGYAITTLQHRQTTWVERYLQSSAAASDLFLVQQQPPPPGHIFRQPALARTLRRLSEQGSEDFYHGSIARAIAEDMQRHSGLITKQDLKSCNLPVERQPVSVDYQGLRVVSVPPPGGGLQLLLALKVLEQLSASGDPASWAAWYERIALSTYAVFRERENGALTGHESSSSGPGWLLSDERVSKLTARIREGELWPGQPFAGEGPGDTTHLTVSDNEGNVVALTQSIQSVFGAKVANPELGFVYNNYLCSCLRYPHPNGLAANCLPRSNAAPTVLLRETVDGSSPVLALGGAGSRRITSAILQVISLIVDRGLRADDAVAAPRVHARLSGKVWIEEPAAQPEVIARLQKHFTEVQVRPAQNFKLGCVQALQWLPQGRMIGAADPRRDGLAGALN
jgi:gamma-glutamyltranspeptidase / glutathione hydrolase